MPGRSPRSAWPASIFAYADAYRQGCHEVRLWNVATRADRRLASHCFVSSSTERRLGVIASGGRGLWLTYTGGNIREWSLWTKAGQGLPGGSHSSLPMSTGRRR